ncbi:condensation domain-containing protein [Nocardia sp. NPDC127579]|uniref:condensation domain-containing protein n=1 Tax=Nocardia sp. NPDC127579 TaxID=3345402 RepID=UPI00362C4398
MMRLLFLDQLAPAPGTLLEWTAVPARALVADPTPPTSNQRIHLAAGGETTWLAGAFDVVGPIDEQALAAAFATWILRHDALHLCFSAPGPGRSAAVRVVADADIRLLARAPETVATTDEARAALRDRLDEACRPFSFPPYFLGAITRSGTSTVIVGFDHAICDAWSITIAVAELDELYRGIREQRQPGSVTQTLPEPGSFLSYLAREAAIPSSATASMIPAWQEFLREAGDDLPRFPLDLGVPVGALAPFGSDVRTLLGPADTDALHSRAKAAGYAMFAALLAATASSTSELGGPSVMNLLVPVHARREPRNHDTFGWLVGNGPVRVAVEKDFATTAAAADAAIRSGRNLSQVPATHVLDDPGTWLRPTRRDLFSVSYVDYRFLPGGSRSETSRSRPRNPVQFSRSAPLDDVQLWFTRTDDGLSVRTRFPDTPAGRLLIADLLDRLAKTLIAEIQERPILVGWDHRQYRATL